MVGVSYNSSIVTDGLVLCLDAANRRSYPGTGTTWTDLSGNGNNGTLTNGPTFTGDNGGGIVFDGANDNVVGPTFSSVLNYQQSGSIECLFKIISTPNVNYENIWGFCQTGNRVIWVDSIIGSSLRFVWALSTGTLGAITTNILVDSNRDINSLVCSYENISTNILFKVFINGVFYQSSTISGSLRNSPSESLQLAKNGAGGQHFNCNIYNFKIYNRALSANEVQQNYNANRGRYGI